MVRSGKVPGDSPSESQAKMAARAAAKASRELEEEFAPETSSMTKPVPVAVGASPAQIPRNPDVVTALSLTLPVPTSKNSQETYTPPSTVTIPNQDFAPPPPQDSSRDALSVPTIRSRMNYSAITIEYAYLIDVED